jgi:hypothetical protein
MTDVALQALIEDDTALRQLIGRRVRYLGQAYEIADLLPDDDLMVLASDEDTDVQEDSYGRAHRLVPKRQNLRFRDAEGKPSHIWEAMTFLDGPVSAE